LFVPFKNLVAILSSEKEGFRLIVNGSNYQEFPQLYFHPIPGNEQAHSSSQTKEN